jgi:hypothetical protein
MALDTRFPAGMTTFFYKDMPLGSRRGIFIAASKTEKAADSIWQKGVYV